MAKSLFQKDNTRGPAPSPRELIQPEIDHLKKGYSIRHAPGAKRKTSPWLVILALGALGWLYLMDPILHAWYKGEAIQTYLYLHDFGAGPQLVDLIATGILAPSEIEILNRRQGSFRNYYASPEAANREARAIIHYVTALRLLHAGKYEQLGPVCKLRYFLFIRTGLTPPMEWNMLDPSAGN